MPKWLKNHLEHPIKTGIFVEVVGSILASSIITVVVTLVLSKFVTEVFFKQRIQVPLWLFVFISATAALALVVQIGSWFFAKKSRRKAGEPKRVVLVIPGLAQNGWFPELIQELYKLLERNGYDVILKIPIEEFSVYDQQLIFEQLKKRPHDFVGGIIVTYKHPGIEKDITELCAEIPYPVVFADVRPFEKAADYPDNTAFVGCDAEKIGVRAAHRVAQHLRGLKKSRPIVKVICSENSQTRRQEAFCRKLRELVEESESIEAVDIEIKRGEFKRSTAKDIAKRFFAESVEHPEEKKFVDAVFCTNDEMALGVYDAMLSVPGVGYVHPFLIGVDGSKGAIRLIDDKDADFHATVKQPKEKMSQEIVTLLRRMIDGKPCPTETLLEPELYDRETAKAQGKHQL